MVNMNMELFWVGNNFVREGAIYILGGGEQPLDHKPWGHGVHFEFYLLGGCQILFLNILNHFLMSGD